MRAQTIRRLGVAAGGALLLAACGSTSSSSSGTPSGTDGAKVLQQAIDSTAQAEKGTNRQVDPTPRPAAKGKKIAVISAGQNAISSQVPADAVNEAAKAIGWDSEVYDGKLDPSTYPNLVRQAIATGKDGIILVAIDCNRVRQPLQEAKAKGIAVVPAYGFDCSDPKAGGDKESLFSATPNYGPKSTDAGAFTKIYGADQANYIIADSQNKAKIIVVTDPEFTVLNYTYEGFKETIDKSGGSQVVATVEVTANDLTGGQAVPKIQAELTKHPDATWIKSPHTYLTILGIIPALGAQVGKVKVMGGEGFKPELDLLRQGKIHAANVISSAWSGWSSVDAMNSFFIGQKPVDSGIGWTVLDKDHNLPADGEWTPTVDFRAAYKKAWGVG